MTCSRIYEQHEMPHGLTGFGGSFERAHLQRYGVIGKASRVCGVTQSAKVLYHSFCMLRVRVLCQLDGEWQPQDRKLIDEVPRLQVAGVTERLIPAGETADEKALE